MHSVRLIVGPSRRSLVFGILLVLVASWLVAGTARPLHLLTLPNFSNGGHLDPNGSPSSAQGPTVDPNGLAGRSILDPIGGSSLLAAGPRIDPEGSPALLAKGLGVDPNGDAGLMAAGCGIDPNGHCYSALSAS